MNFLKSVFLFIVTAYALFGINPLAQSKTLPDSTIIPPDDLKTLTQDSLKSVDSLIFTSENALIASDTSWIKDFGPEYNNLLDKQTIVSYITI